MKSSYIRPRKPSRLLVVTWKPTTNSSFKSWKSLIASTLFWSRTPKKWVFFPPIFLSYVLIVASYGWMLCFEMSAASGSTQLWNLAQSPMAIVLSTCTDEFRDLIFQQLWQWWNLAQFPAMTVIFFTIRMVQWSHIESICAIQQMIARRRWMFCLPSYVSSKKLKL